jgi:hypothetical protein
MEVGRGEIVLVRLNIMVDWIYAEGRGRSLIWNLSGKFNVKFGRNNKTLNNDTTTEF